MITENNSENKKSKEHIINLKNREKINISGVKEVISYNEKNIFLETVQGTLEIKGKDFKIQQLNLEQNDLYVKGYLEELNYSQEKPGKSFFKNLFK